LDFINQTRTLSRIQKLKSQLQAQIIQKTSKPIEAIQHELNKYFNNNLSIFKTPIKFIGTPFQQKVWQALMKIPYGQTCSYKELAQNIGKATAFRAAANANGANKFVIIVPCHRVINTGGKLGGYSSGLIYKEKLLKLESNAKNILI